ncbi:MAG: NEW3 domain-containing protein, partial [Candidatus Poseidoniaceae archaeon]
MRNDGVMPFSSEMGLVLFNATTGTTNEYWQASNTETLQPGSIFSPSGQVSLNAGFSASSLTGLWNISAVYWVNSSIGNNMYTHQQFDAVFSDYISEMIGPADRTTAPGDSTTLTYIISNVGSTTDIFDISVSSGPFGWADTSLDTTSTDPLTAGQTTTLSVVVNVPQNAGYSDVDIITLSITSSGSGYSLTHTSRVMAGEFFEATVDITNDTTYVLPGKTDTIAFNVTNTGNANGNFNLIAGLSLNALNWEYNLSIENTGELMVGESVSGFIHIEVPPIQLPLVDAEHNAAGDSLSVFIIAQANEGSLPATDSGQIEVRPAIVVDPGLPVDTIVLSESDVMNAGSTVGVNEILALEVQVRHNLVSDLAETIDANITVGEITFEALTSGGFNEVDRWNATVSPGEATGLILGESFPASLGIQSQSGQLPLAGTIKIPITTTPTLGSVHTSSSVYAPVLQQNLSIVVPKVINGEITETGPLDADVGVDTDFMFTFGNTGNDRSSFRLEIVENLPTGWYANLTTTGPDDTIVDLASDYEDYPATSGGHLSLVTLTVKTDPLAPSGLLQPLTIRYYDLDSGVYIGQQTMDIRVGETINASLTPTNQSIDITPYEQLSAFVNIENTGNAPTTFSVSLDNGGYDDVLFELDSSTTVVIGAGYESSVRVNIVPSPDASADEFYMAVLTVTTLDENGDLIELKANIVANVSEVHDVQLTAPDSLAAVPGTVLTLPFSLVNTGNLVETVNINITVDGGWGTTPTVQSFTVPIDGESSGSFDINIPALDGTDNLLDGAIHDANLTVYDPVTDDVYVLKKVQLLVAPVFTYTIEGWENEYFFHEGDNRVWTAVITNTGNKDVYVDLGYEVRSPGLTILSDDWIVNSDSPDSLFLPRNVPVQLTVSVDKNAAGSSSTTLSTAADLRITIVPTDVDVDGSGELMTSLKMKRLFDTGYADKLQAPANDDPVTVPIEYSHIPYLNTAPAAYSIEFCGIERILDIDALGLNEEDYVWNISLINLEGEESVHYINLSAPCVPGSELIQLPERPAYVLSPNLIFNVKVPDRPNILPGDGYDITMRLHHPDPSEPITEETFRFALNVYADPMIDPDSQKIVDAEGNELDQIMEGQTAYIEFDLKNEGTALAVGISSQLVCEGLVIEDAPSFVPFLAEGEVATLRWKITGETLDWWEQSKNADCTVSILSDYALNNVVENDELNFAQAVDSSAPSTLTSFAGFGIALIVTIGLLGLTNQNEKYRLGAVYSGVIMLGFLFHLYDASWWGPVTIVFASLWVWRMAWRSSEEFRYIHEDYQRARKGISTIYADHFQALTDSRRQLTIILSLPLLGFVGVILGLPPQMTPDETNLISLVSYILISTFVVWFVLRRANKLYGSLYGKLTDIEVKATRIERD